MNEKKVLLLFILLMLVLSLVYSQDSNKLKPLKEYSLGEWRSLDVESRNSVWKSASSKDKLNLLKQYSSVIQEGFDNPSLSWIEGEVIGTDKTSVNLKRLPKELKSLKFNGKEFMYDFGDRTVSTKYGSIREGEKSGELQIVLEGYKDTHLSLGEGGEAKITSEGISFKNAELRVGSRLFTQNNPEKESFLKIVEDHHFQTRNTIVTTSDVVLTTPDITTDILFKEGDYSKEGLSQFVQVNDNKMTIVGKDIEAEIKKDFSKIDIAGEGVILRDGDTEVLFDKEKVNMIRKGESALYTVELIQNGFDKDRYFVIEQTSDGNSKYFRDHQRLIRIGEFYMNAGGEVSNSRLGAVLTGSSRVGRVDEGKIPDDVTKEEYFQYLSDSKYKSLDLRNHVDITSDRLVEGITKKLTEPSQKEPPTTSKSPSRLLGIMGLLNRGDSSKIARTAYDVTMATSAISYLLPPILKISEEYNRYPKDTNFHLELKGDRAFAVFTPPKAKVREPDDTFKTVSLEPINVEIPLNIANYIMTRTYELQGINEELWMQRQDRLRTN